MKVFGLTGGVGMGKSTAASLALEMGAAMADTDAIARQVVQRGQPAVEEIKATFGDSVIAADGTLRRDELARLVFSDARARRQLEAILHPRIRSIWLARVEGWRRMNQSVGVVVIPLLFETNAEAHFDATICVACSVPAQQQRLLARGWTAEQIEQRRLAQWPIEKKMERSGYVIWTEGSIELQREQLRCILLQEQDPPHR